MMSSKDAFRKNDLKTEPLLRSATLEARWLSPAAEYIVPGYIWVTIFMANAFFRNEHGAHLISIPG